MSMPAEVRLKFRKRWKRRLWREQKGICWLCDQPMGIHEATRDHVLPRSKGGGNERANLRLAHEVCNKLRQNVDEAEAREYVQAKLKKLVHGQGVYAERARRIVGDAARAAQT